MNERQKYEVVIGLEVHAQLLTKTKAYSSDENIYGAIPNTKTSAISLGHPGTLPRSNEKVIEYAVKLVSMTRPSNELAPQITKDWLDWGAGPRASTFLIMAAQAKCLLADKSTPDIDDIKNIAKPILRHRIITNFTAEADGISKEDVLDQLIDQLKI